jgi:hypothetical protein
VQENGQRESNCSTWYVGGAFDVAKQNRTEAKRSVVVVVRSDTKLGVCDPVTTQFHAPVSLSLSIFTRTVRILLLFSLTKKRKRKEKGIMQ